MRDFGCLRDLNPRSGAYWKWIEHTFGAGLWNIPLEHTLGAGSWSRGMEQEHGVVHGVYIYIYIIYLKTSGAVHRFTGVYTVVRRSQKIMQLFLINYLRREA